MKLVVDTENDNLLPKITKFHCGGAIDVDTLEEYWFRPDQHKEFLELLDKADTIIFHNAYGYDVPAMYKLFGWKPKAKVTCTMVMSQVLNYRRFGFGHSLKAWGKFFDDHKGDYNGGFEEFNEDMFEYMKQDVRLLLKTYNYLMKEIKAYIRNSGSKDIIKAIETEMLMDAIMTEQCENGWKFDKKGAANLSKEIKKQMSEIENYINPMLSYTVKRVDDAPRKMQFLKNGKPHKWCSNWFKLDDSITADNCPIWGPFSRVEFSVGDIGNTTTVKTLLYSLGWEPDEWNWKKEGSKFTKVSPKLTDSSLERLGDVGLALMKYYTLRSRKSILDSWIKEVGTDGRLHGDVFNIGTPTFRQSHKIIANLPGGKSVLGKEIRELFVSEKGYTLVSADSSSCQLRLLAHFMNDEAFTKSVIDGKAHDNNAEILTRAARKVLKDQSIVVPRSTAKPFIFAFLYGAGGPKLSSILGMPERVGTALKKQFQKAYPKLDSLINTCKDLAESQGFIPGLDDRPIFTDSAHKALNYLIQGAEAVVMKATVVMIDQRLKEAGIDFRHLLFYHDEHTVEVKEEQAEQARDIIIQCFEDAPKIYGVNIMTCGDCKIGKDYFSVH